MGVAVCALAIGGCALNAPRPFVCDATTGAPRPVPQGNTPLSRWTAECAKAIGEASWPPRHAEGLDGTELSLTTYFRYGKMGPPC